MVQNKKLVYLPLLAKLKVKTFTVGLLFTGCEYIKPRSGIHNMVCLDSLQIQFPKHYNYL